MTFSCTIPGTPQEQSRPRIVRRGPHAGLADTAEVANYKAYVKAMIALADPPKPLLDGPLVLSVDVFIKRPKSWPKRRQHADTKPDLDNYIKLLSDCLEGLVYTNDSRIVELRARKHLDESPRVEVRVESAEPALEVIQ